MHRLDTKINYSMYAHLVETKLLKKVLLINWEIYYSCSDFSIGNIATKVTWVKNNIKKIYSFKCFLVTCQNIVNIYSTRFTK